MRPILAACVVAGAIGAASAGAAPTRPNEGAPAAPVTSAVLPEHPRIWLRRTDWDGPTVATIKANLDRPEFKARWSMLPGSRAGKALKYLLTSDPKDLDAALAAMKGVKLSWSSPSYGGIEVAELAAAYDWLHDRLDEPLRTAVRAELERCGMEFVTFCRRGLSPIYYARYPGAILGFVTVGLALKGESPKADEMLDFFRTWGVNEYFRGMAWIDGAAVGGNYDYMHVYQAIAHIVAAWWSATGENLVDWAKVNQNDWLNKMLLFELWAILPDNRFYKTGDLWGGSSYFARQEYQMPLDILTRLTRSGYGRTKQMLMNESLGPYNYHGGTAYDFFIFQDPTIPAKPLSDLPLAAEWGRESVGYTFFRAGWGMDDPVVFFRGGGVMNVHGHMDVGNFQVWKRVPLAIKSGAYSSYGNRQHQYAWSAMSANCVVFTTDEQDWGQQLGENGRKVDNDTFAHWMATWTKRRMDTGRIEAFDPKPGEARVRADLSRTNPDAKLKRWVRELVWLDNRALVVVDVIDLARPEVQCRWLLHSLTEPEVSGMLTTISVDAAPVFPWIPKAGARLFCRTLLPAQARIEKVGGPGKECWIAGVNAIGKVDDKSNFTMQIGRWRIEVTPAVAGTHHVFAHVLTPVDQTVTAPPPVAAALEGDDVVVTVNGKPVRVKQVR
jgi:hypothetical protein